MSKLGHSHQPTMDAFFIQSANAPSPLPWKLERREDGRFVTIIAANGYVVMEWDLALASENGSEQWRTDLANAELIRAMAEAEEWVLMSSDYHKPQADNRENCPVCGWDCAGVPEGPPLGCPYER